MAFQSATNTCLIELKWNGPAPVTWQNNLHFSKSGFVEDDMDDLVTDVATEWTNSSLRGNVSTDAILQTIVATDLRSQGATQTVTVVTLAGTNGTDMAAQAAACIATLRTGLRGRSYRGRFYMGGITEGSLVDGEYLSSVGDNLVEFLEDLQTAAAVNGWTLDVLSRFHDGSERGTALGEEVTEIEVRSLLPGSQRRRNQRP